MREDLRGEREANKNSFKIETANWRSETAELENNLMVLAHLQKHPGTADEKLPGSLRWSYASAPSRHAAWDAARNSGLTGLMDREEIEQYEDGYNKLKAIDYAHSLTWNAINDASRYELTDSRLSHLSPSQIGEITTLTQTALTKHWLEGVALENATRILKDFLPSITSDELSEVRKRKSAAGMEHDPALALTISRMKAAGYVP